jgi:hypothetical protein
VSIENSEWLLALVLIYALLIVVGRQRSLPLLALFTRWWRWLTFAFAVAYSLNWFMDGRQSYAVLLGTGLLIWPLLETIYNWVAVLALSRSSLPLFPRFSINDAGDGWPAQPDLLKVRTWIRQNGFKSLQNLRSELFEGFTLRTTVFSNEAQTLRLQVMFIPQKNGQIQPSYTFSSVGADDRRLITDNIQLPFGGFYPEGWQLSRHPLTRSPAALLRRHQRRLATAGFEPLPQTGDPLEDINEQQERLERLNTNLGFLFPRALREEHGNITREGCYRIWKEIWLINYFGITVR